MKPKLLSVLKSNFKKKKSLLAFNVQNVYHLLAIKQVTEELQLPVIVQFSARYVSQFEKRFGFNLLSTLYKNQFMYFHLDHCQDLEIIKFCIDAGFDGVMYDGSSGTLKENIEKTLIVKELADIRGCIVEGELGEIGGVEDGVGTANKSFVNLEEIVDYVDATGIDLLALGIGNAHGFYTSLKGIDTSILRKAQELITVDQLFVLHGGSGLPENMVLDTIQNGVVKINISTQIKQTTNDAIKSYLNIGELYNEINFERMLIKRLQLLFKEMLKKYTV